MNLETELLARFETLADSLRENVTLATDTALQELLEIVEADRATATVNAPRAPLPQDEAPDRAAIDRLAEAVRSLDGGLSLTNVLNRLVDHAAREASRVALLLVEGDRLRGWRWSGFDPSEVDAAALGCTLAESGIIGEAVRGGAAVADDSPDGGVVPWFARAAAGQALALPIAIGGQVVAVLYADQSGGPASEALGRSWRPVVEILGRHAARKLESIVAFRAAQALTGSPGPGSPFRVEWPAAASYQAGGH